MVGTEKFPKGLRVLLVDDHPSEASSSLQHPELSYSVTEVDSLQAALQCFSGGAAAFDCVLVEQALLDAAAEGQVEALFSQARQGQAPVVLMAEAPSQAVVLAGVHLGAADYLERPLSFHKLKTLWQHKIRGMMQSANGRIMPRAPSCPQLARCEPTSTATTSRGGGASTSGFLAPLPPVLPRCGSLPGLSLTCPATPSPHTSCGGAPQASSSLGSDGAIGGSTRQYLGLPADTQRSDATSGTPRPPAEPATAVAAVAGTNQLAGAGAVLVVPGGAATMAPPAPLAYLRGTAGLGQPGMPPVVDPLAAPVQWPCLPVGMVWGAPMGCGVLPPLQAQAPSAPAAPAAPAVPHSSGAGEQQAQLDCLDLDIKWCAPASLPIPAATTELLLPEGFSLVPQSGGGSTSAAGRGPLGLRLTITPDLLASLSGAFAAPGAAAV